MSMPEFIVVQSAMERRSCTKEHPMPMEDKGKYQWTHADAKKTGEFFNLWLYTCPHCNFTFHAMPS